MLELPAALDQKAQNKEVVVSLKAVAKKINDNIDNIFLKLIHFNFLLKIRKQSKKGIAIDNNIKKQFKKWIIRNNKIKK